jgi:hypothetical protein
MGVSEPPAPPKGSLVRKITPSQPSPIIMGEGLNAIALLAGTMEVARGRDFS